MKNSTKQKIKKALMRAVYTFAECAIPMIPVGVMINQIDWLTILGVPSIKSLFASG